ncbi:MAG: WD40 repeat domain-containing protein, partial [Patescibacteria group bacterium]|nr:WD40 repeat domain-containing protein [Patescibacteria group bacterium]
QCVSTLAISRDGKYVASSSDTLVYVWDYETGILLHTFEGHKDYVNALVFDPGGGYLVSGSGGDDWNESAIKIWDLNKGKLIRTKSSHWKSITSLSFSPNGKYLVSGARDKTVNVWDTIKGRLLTTLTGHKNSVIDIAISNEKKVVSVSYDDTIKVWDADSGEVLREMYFCPSKNSNARFDLVSIVLTPDHEFVIGGLQASLKDGGKLCIWKLSNGEIIQTLPIVQDFSGHYEELNQLAISYDGLFILSASRDRMVKVWMEFMEYMDFQERIQNS